MFLSMPVWPPSPNQKKNTGNTRSSHRQPDCACARRRSCCTVGPRAYSSSFPTACPPVRRDTRRMHGDGAQVRSRASPCSRHAPRPTFGTQNPSQTKRSPPPPPPPPTHTHTTTTTHPVFFPRQGQTKRGEAWGRCKCVATCPRTMCVPREGEPVAVADAVAVGLGEAVHGREVRVRVSPRTPTACAPAHRV